MSALNVNFNEDNEYMKSVCEFQHRETDMMCGWLKWKKHENNTHKNYIYI